jgi:hypothetical protein
MRIDHGYSSWLTNGSPRHAEQIPCHAENVRTAGDVAGAKRDLFRSLSPAPRITSTRTGSLDIRISDVLRTLADSALCRWVMAWSLS